MDLKTMLENMTRMELKKLEQMIGKMQYDYVNMLKKIEKAGIDTSDVPLFKDLVKEALGDWTK